jgi:hypothetical protein
MLEHERFEELASLAAVGELSPEERDEFSRHKESCSKCSQVVAEISSVSAAAFLAGPSRHQDPAVQDERHRRAREAVAQRLPMVVPVPFARGYKRLVAAGIAAAFLAGTGLGVGMGLRQSRAADRVKTSATVPAVPSAQSESAPTSAKSESAHLQAALADLQKQMDQARGENHALREKLSISDQHTEELETRLDAALQQSNAQAHELEQARGDLNATRNAVTQAQTSISAHKATIDALQYNLADREARLTEVSANLDREREMLSAGREVRDIMGARDLHIVDVIDRDGKGRPRKAFGRAFYTQGKSLIFYAFDLPAKNTSDGKFVYAAWGSNSNKLTGQVPHSLGIFYNDDQTQHRWAMKFDNAKVLEEIDTVFVTLEPAGRPFSSPTGRAVLEAYFGTPPNHP